MNTVTTPEKHKSVDLGKIQLPKFGFHYTSQVAWNRIQKEGMVPYLINKPELDKYYPNGVRGIWIWPQELQDKSEMCSVLYQMATKQTHLVVKLKIQYHEEELLTDSKFGTINLFHYGAVNDYICHIHEKANILTEEIEPMRVEMVKRFDIVKLITE